MFVENIDLRGGIVETTFPLEGIKVVDFSRVLSGPFCTMLLADLGAEVIKVEMPKVGDENRKVRTYEGRTEKDEDYFYPMNRNKKSIEVDLKTDKGKELVKELISKGDVVVENFKPGTMKRLNLDYDSIYNVNKKIIYCSISGFGQTGPYADRKAYDSIIQAFTGVMSVTGEMGGKPLRSGLMFGDLSASLYALSSIMVSLYAREKTGLGNNIDLSLADSLLSLFSTNAAEFLANGNTPKPSGAENPGRFPTGSYKCKDQKYIQIMAGSDVIWPLFCKVLNKEGLSDNPLYSTNELRVQNKEKLRKEIIPILEGKSSLYWEEEFNKNGVPCSPINTLKEAFRNEHFEARQMKLPVEHPISGTVYTINNPFRFSSYSTWKSNPPPILGQNNNEIGVKI